MEYIIRSLIYIMFIPYYIHTLVLLRQQSKCCTATIFVNKTTKMLPSNIYYYFCINLFLTNDFFANDIIYLVLGGFLKQVNLIPFWCWIYNPLEVESWLPVDLCMDWDFMYVRSEKNEDITCYVTRWWA